MPDELCVAEKSGGGVMIAMEESCVTCQNCATESWGKHSLKGFFLTIKNTVSISSTYLTR